GWSGCRSRFGCAPRCRVCRKRKRAGRRISAGPGWVSPGASGADDRLLSSRGTRPKPARMSWFLAAEAGVEVLVLAGLSADLDLDLAGLGVLGLGHGHQQQTVAVNRLDPSRIDRGAQAQRAAELGRAKLLPDGLGAVGHLEGQRAFDRQR